MTLYSCIHSFGEGGRSKAIIKRKYSNGHHCCDLMPVVLKPNVLCGTPFTLGTFVPSTSFLCTAVGYMRLPATDNHCACTTCTVTPSASDSASCNANFYKRNRSWLIPIYPP